MDFDKWKEKIRQFLKKYGYTILLFCGMLMVTAHLYAGDLFEDEILEIPYPEFVELMESGAVDTVYYSNNDEFMRVTLLNDETRNMTPEERDEYDYEPEDTRKVIFPSYEEFRKDVLVTGTRIRIEKGVDTMNLVMNLTSVVLPLIMLVWLFKMLQGQQKSFSEKDIILKSDVKFSDVIGQDEIIEDLRFIVELIKDPKKGDRIGAKIPKGLLLQGPPGTGKTLIAKAIAGEAGVPFLQQSASGFIEMYVGLGAKRVRDLFKVAKKHAPCIIFIDEIDAVGGSRDNVKTTSENEQTINALLEQMDGFTGRDGVFVIAATNRADKLDPALVRPGRFDRQVVVNPPRDWHVREELFRHYLSKFKVAEDVDIENLSKQVSGFTGADIAAICNESSIIAVMADKPAIDTACIEEAIDKKIFKGNRSKREQFANDTRIVAYHEAGHAVMSWLSGEPISRASIQATVSGVGGAVFNADRETLFQTNKDFRNRIKIAYAGRASEEIKFGDVTTGASNDITQATQILAHYIERFGFDPDFGMLDISVLSKDHLVDSASVTKRMTKMSNEIYAECVAELKANYDKVEALAQKLLEAETLSGDQIARIIGMPAPTAN